MGKKAIYGTIIILLFCACCKVDQIDKISAINAQDESYIIKMKRDILCLMLAYEGYISGVNEKDGNIYVIMKSGRRILYDDRKVKSSDAKLSNPDLQDMMEQVYPLYGINELMPQDYDPGRPRVYSLLSEVYGDGRKQVESSLTSVKTSGGYFTFSRNNNAAASLQSVFIELSSIINNSRIRAAVFPSSGTFNYRYISGTGRLSPHAFGIAIDLARDSRDYWKWASRIEGQKRLKSYPAEVVYVFEKYNFIWGGKWGHFDILHYEYRPEIILKAKYFSNKVSSGEPWYYGAPYNETTVKDNIDEINETIN